MADFPIIFSPQMVRALLEGRKTMTRRLAWKEGKPKTIKGRAMTGFRRASPWQRVKPGDRLWVRENYRLNAWGEDGELWFKYPANDQVLWVDPTDGDIAQDWIEHACDELDRRGVQLNENGNYPSTAPLATRPSIHMPRWGSRITLIVSGFKIEPLHNISEADAEAEGVYTGKDGDLGPLDISARALFSDLWRTINGADSWGQNPEVVAISFKVEKRNIDDHNARAA